MTDLDQRFRALERTPTPDLWERIREERPESQGAMEPVGKRVVAAAVAASVSVAALLILSRAFREPRVDDAPHSTRTASSPVDREVKDVLRVPVTDFPNAVVVGAGSVWVSAPLIGSPDDDGSGAGEVVRIDPTTGDVIARVAVLATPMWEFGGGGMASDGDEIWIAGTVFLGSGRGSVVLAQRIDTATNELSLRLSGGRGSAADVWVDGSDVWLLMFDPGNRSMDLVHFDSSSGDELGRLTLPTRWSQEVFTAGGAVWVVGDSRESGPISPSTLYRIDPSVMLVTATVELDKPFAAVPSEDAIWVLTSDGFGRLDPMTLEVNATTARSPNCGVTSLVPDGMGGFWCADGEGRLPDLVHLTRDGFLSDRIGGKEYQSEEALTTIARAYDPDTESFWFVQDHEEVVGIQLAPRGEGKN